MARAAAAAPSPILGDLSHHLRLPGTPPYADLNFHRWEAGRSMDWHQHRFLQAIQVLDGTLEVDWGAGWRRLVPGVAHLLPPGGRHRLRSAGHAQFGLNFAVDDDARGLLALLRTACPQPIAVPLSAPPGCIEALLAAESVDHPGDRLGVAAELDRWCLALVACLLNRDPDDARLLQVLRHRLERRIEVAEIAQALHMSRTSAQRLAQRAFGQGLAHLHERLRLERAAHLLAATAAPAGAIATRCGFRDIAHFSRRFRSRYGSAPTAWRRGLG